MATMILALEPPEVCDPVARSAEIARVEDQARDAMRAATEAIDTAAQRNAAETGADAHWAEYKRLRTEAARLRNLACPSTDVSATTPPTLTVRRAVPAEAAVAYAPTPTGASPRFRVEVSGLMEDRQPSARSRFAMSTSAGTRVQEGPSSIVRTNTPPTSTPSFPSLDLVTSPVTNTTRVRSWSSGLDIAVEFASTGLDNAGWRLSGGVSAVKSITKGDTRLDVRDQATGDPTTSYDCRNIFGGYSCAFYQRTPIISNALVLPGNSFARGILGDNVDQTASEVALRFGLGRETTLSVLSRDLSARVGVEVAGGWWSVQELETLRFVAWDPTRLGGLGDSLVRDYVRKADGPTASASLTGRLGGPLWGAFRWSVNGAAGLKISDLSATSQRVDGVNFTSPPPLSVYQARSGDFIGSVGGRLEFVQAPWNAFVSLERRRDLSLESTISNRDVLSEAAVTFADGTAFTVRPVYSSRLRLGLGYSF
jgi:hypothetical protein